MLYTFVAAIPRYNDQTGDWQDLLRQQLASRQFSVAEEERLLHGDDLIGFYRFISLKEGRGLFQSAPWFALAQECPWFAGLAGFFSWTHVADQALAEDQLIPMLFQQSTVIVRTDNQEFRQCVRLIDFILTNLLSKYGFGDGDALLSRNEDYLLDVYDAIVERLQAAGLEGHVVLLQTAHNPLQLSGDLYRDGVPVSDVSLALAELYVPIWAYDLTILDDPLFWQE